MIRIEQTDLPPATASALVAFQQDIDALPTYAERVAAAKEKFESKNKRENAVFKVVRATLTAMCAGRCRCMYCEDSAADEVEHVWPKNLYPSLVFAWLNYLYACGPCNGPKKDKFQVISHKTGTIVDVTRSPRAPVTEPEQGRAVLIDPRTEDPLSFMRLDIKGTFLFAPSHPLGTTERERAAYTIQTLGLNARDLLPDARRDAYVHYHSLLHSYVVQRAAPHQRGRTESVLRRTHHPTVWAEMKRQHQDIAELRALFGAAPEALGW